MWSLPASDVVLYGLSLVALTAQAMTAALAAGKRSMDWAGVCMLGCITALGGGTIRDVLLGITRWSGATPVLPAADGGRCARHHPDRAWCTGSTPRFWCSMRSAWWSSPWPA
jgi:hypothetical protein